MKRLLFFFAVLLITAVTASAQTIVKGDMNGDGRLTLTDMTLLANTIVGRMEVENIDLTVFAYTVNNEKIVGRWYKSDGTYMTFNADGTTDYPGGATYEYYPLRDRILVSNQSGTVIKTISLSAVTDVYMLVIDYATDVTTCYVHSDYMVSELTLSETSLTMNSNATAQLSVMVAPSNAYNKNVAWSSSDESVATVDQNGLVTAVAGGSCTITAMATDGSGVTATCPVTVIQLVTGITLSETSLTLEMDGYKKLTATVLPANASNKSVTWSSSNENVAVVASNGGVTAVGYGTCTITCTAADASGVTATCSVTVVQTIAVTSITLSQSTLSMNAGTTSNLTATVLPTNATNASVTWSSSNTSVATVDANGQVMAVAAGTCTITCSATDGSGVFATCTVTVTQLVTAITLNPSALSIDEGETSTLTATVLPNDASNKSITWSSSNTSVATVGANGQVTAVAVGTCTITCAATDGSGVTGTCAVTVVAAHEYVDLGLPSGTLWATTNIGAANPEDYGDYFAWGETTPKSDYSSSTYTYSSNPTELPTSADAAYVNWGSNWRMPSLAQFQELINSSYTTTTWTTLNGVKGRKITSKTNGNSIFLPAAGYRGASSLYSGGSRGDYWSRTLFTGDTGLAYDLYFYSSSIIMDNDGRYYGRSVRPVRLSQ